MFKKIEDIIRKYYPQGVAPLHEPVIGEIEKKYVMDCLDSTFVSSVGQYVGEMENRVASYTGASYAVATSNGTSALQIALLLAGVNPGDEVLTQNLTFVATANAILYTGAKPIFLDSAQDNLGLCADLFEKFLLEETVQQQNQCINKKTGRRISAIVPMHVFGHAVNLSKMISLAKEAHIKVVEDAAEALGSFYKNKHLGTLGDIGILSFNGNKVVTTGGGGMILLNDEELAYKAKHITTTAKTPHAYEFYHDQMGFNYRMPNLNAALGCAQMDQLEHFLFAKREIANYYKKEFKNLDIQMVDEPENSKSNFWLNAIYTDQKEELLEYLIRKEIFARPIWNLMSDLSYLKEFQVYGDKNARRYREQIVCVPSGVPVEMRRVI